MNAAAANPIAPITAASPAVARAGKRKRARVGMFAAFFGFIVCGVGLAFAINPDADAGLAAYVLLLGLCCTAPLLVIRSLLGRATLLLVFQGIFFAFFGLGDWAALLVGATPHRPPDVFITGGEIAILLTSLCFSAGYALVAGTVPAGVRGLMSRDWSPRSVAIMGVVFWVVGFLLNVMFIGGNDFRHATSTGFAVFGGFAGFAVLLTYLLPIGDMCMIYLYLVHRSRLALVGLVCMFACEFVIGFLSSAKEFAFRGILLFLIGVVFLRGRLPLRGILVGMLLAMLTFSFFQDVRAHVTRAGHIDLTAVFERLSSDPSRTFRGDNTLGGRFERGVGYFASRGNLKTSVETAVAHTGVDVPYQYGHTLEPLLYAFVPRAWMPDKADPKLGLLFNKEFKVSIVRTVYIAAGENGELYWNFGWAGLTLGMLLIGVLMGATNVALNLERTTTLPRFLLLMLAAYLIAFRFEAGIATQWALWLRSLVLLLLVHALTPKARAGVVAARPA